MRSRYPVLALTVGLMVAAGGVGSAYAQQPSADAPGGAGSSSAAPRLIDDTSGDPLIAGAGDIACPGGSSITPTGCHHRATASLLAGADKVLTMGDNQYEDGALRDYVAAYDPTWGQHKSITAPVPGNHEYHQSGAAGYFDYFGTRAGPRGKGYYSYNLRAWHLVALNSSVPMREGSPQNNWLEQDLAANRAACTLTYFHHPRYSAGKYAPGIPSVKPLWTDMLADRVDVTLAGHDHQYQRWTAMGNAGTASAAGVRQFIVGTGGRSHYGITTSPAGLQKAHSTSFGVLRMVLHAGSYDWEFAAEDGTVKDSGTARCV